MSLADFNPSYFRFSEDGSIVTAEFTVAHLTDEENIEQLGRELFALVEQFGCRKLVLDLNQVKYLTSSVLGKMISLHRKLHRNEGKLVICNLGETVSDVLTSSRLIEYFHVVEDSDQAKNNFD